MSNNNNTNTNDPKEEITEFTLDVTESKGNPTIQDGVYSAEVEKIVLKANMKGKDGMFFDMLVWSFVVDDEGTQKFIDGTSSTKVTTMSKAYSWIAAITGKEPVLNTGFTPSMVKGKKCQVVVKNVQQKKDFNGKITEVTKSEVKEVLKAKKSK